VCDANLGQLAGQPFFPFRAEVLRLELDILLKLDLRIRASLVVPLSPPKVDRGRDRTK
jgi:hypothetical protein